MKDKFTFKCFIVKNNVNEDLQVLILQRSPSASVLWFIHLFCLVCHFNPAVIKHISLLNTSDVKKTREFILITIQIHP